MNKELIEKVRRNFNLNIYETKVWLALLEKGDANIAQIHEISKVPRSRIYDVLKSLETKGFCVERLGRPIKYVAVEPSLVIEKLKKSVENEAKEKIQILEKMSDSEEFKQLEYLYNTSFNLTDKVGTAIKGKNNLLSHLENASKKARSRVLLVSNPDSIERDFLFLIPILSNKARSGIEVAIGLSNSNPELSEKIREKIENSHIKLGKLDIDARFCIIDDNVLLIMNPEEEDYKALWLQSSFFANTLASLIKK